MARDSEPLQIRCASLVERQMVCFGQVAGDEGLASGNSNWCEFYKGTIRGGLRIGQSSRTEAADASVQPI